uniref:Uncharacterized protein n=1 Tax=Anopheles merus TaxID=30066 RepID=A0A182V4X5_ANOME
MLEQQLQPGHGQLVATVAGNLPVLAGCAVARRLLAGAAGGGSGGDSSGGAATTIRSADRWPWPSRQHLRQNGLMSRIWGAVAGRSTTFIVRVAILVWKDGAASVISQLYLPLLCGSTFTSTSLAYNHAKQQQFESSSSGRSHSQMSVALVPTSTATGTCMWTLSSPSTLWDTEMRGG